MSALWPAPENTRLRAMSSVSTIARSAAVGLVAGATLACASAQNSPRAPGDPQTVVIPTAASSATEEDSTAPPEPRGSAGVLEAPAGDKSCCKGMNDCKGKGNCKTDVNDCRGLNECKGQGGCQAHCPE